MQLLPSGPHQLQEAVVALPHQPVEDVQGFQCGLPDTALVRVLPCPGHYSPHCFIFFHPYILSSTVQEQSFGRIHVRQQTLYLTLRNRATMPLIAEERCTCHCAIERHDPARAGHKSGNQRTNQSVAPRSRAVSSCTMYESIRCLPGSAGAATAKDFKAANGRNDWSALTAFRQFVCVCQE